MTVKNTELADELILRLNKLIEDPDVRKDISALIAKRIPCSQATLDHKTIQASPPSKDGLCECGAYGGPGCRLCKPTFGVLGVLNGLVGTIGSGPRAGWGLITAYEEDDGIISRFMRTEENPKPKAEG